LTNICVVSIFSNPGEITDFDVGSLLLRLDTGTLTVLKLIKIKQR